MEDAAQQLLSLGLCKQRPWPADTVEVRITADRQCTAGEVDILSSRTNIGDAVGSARTLRKTPSSKDGQRKGTSKSFSQQQLGVHPVVRLGWKPLCEVHCNGLVGQFLGGHDRELFIRCTSGEYEDLPLVDYTQGGCIMSCSQFEKAAGRELSKKWKESIHVVGEGEGSKATLVSWLKRKAEAQFGEDVVGQRVWVCWISEGEYYRGSITGYSKQNGKHKVQYNDRLVEELHLPVELISFSDDKPGLPIDQDGSVEEHVHDQQDTHPMSPPTLPPLPRTLGRSVSMPGTWAGRKVSVPPSMLCHQGSGISVSSVYEDEGGPMPFNRRLDRKFRARMRLEESCKLPKREPDEEYRPPARIGTAGLPPLRQPVRRRLKPWADEEGVDGDEEAEAEQDSQGGSGGKRMRLDVPGRRAPAGPPPESPSELLHAMSMPASFAFRKVHTAVAALPPAPVQDVPRPSGPTLASPGTVGDLRGALEGPVGPGANLSRDPSRTIEARLQSLSPEPALDLSDLAHPGSCHSLPPSRPSSRPPSSAPIGPPCAPPSLPSLGVLQGEGAAPDCGGTSVESMAPVLPLPPCNGFDETNVRTISRWMNCLALALDSDLVSSTEGLAHPCTSEEQFPPQSSGTGVLHNPMQELAFRTPPPAHAPCTPLPSQSSLLSASGRFQTLLVYARKNNSIHGYYEAMLTRYDAFKSQPDVLRRKMVEFVLAALHEDSTQASRELLILARERRQPSNADIQDQFAV